MSDTVKLRLLISPNNLPYTLPASRIATLPVVFVNGGGGPAPLSGAGQGGGPVGAGTGAGSIPAMPALSGAGQGSAVAASGLGSGDVQPNLLPAGTPILFEGDSNTGWGFGTGINWSKIALMASGGRVWLPPGGHFANPGSTVAFSGSSNSMDARKATVASKLGEYAGKKIVWFQIGTNAEAGQAASYPATTELAAIIAAWKAADPGNVIVIANTLPYNTDNSNQARADNLNAWLRTPGNVDHILDVNAVSSPIVSNMGSPNTHYNNAQHADVGLAGAALLATIVDAGTPYTLNTSPVYEAASDFAAFSSQTATGISGNFPANWTASRSLGTGSAIGSATTQDGQPAARLDLTGGVSGVTQITLRRLVPGSFAPGTVVDLYGKVRLLSASAPIAYAGLSEVESSSHFPIGPASGMDLLPTDLPDVYLYRVWAVPMAGAETQLDIRLRVSVNAGETASIIFSEPEAATRGASSNTPPSATTAPVMNAATVGGSPSHTAGTYTGSPTPSVSFAYYLESGVASGTYDAIPGSTVFAAGDVGKRAYVSETALNVAGSSSQDSATVTIAAASSAARWNNAVNFGAPAQLTYSNGDSTVSNNANTNGARFARGLDGKTSGKWFARLTLAGGATSRGLGLCLDTVGGSTGGTNGTSRWYWSGASIFSNSANRTMPNISTTDGDYEIAFDADTNLLWMRAAGGNWNNNASADPATGTDGLSISGRGSNGLFILGTMPNNTTASATFNTAGSPPVGFTRLPEEAPASALSGAGQGSALAGSGTGSGDVPVMVARNAVNILGPGHGTGVGTTTSNGTAANVGPTFVNRSGAAITDMSVVLSGWFLASAGTTAVGNSYPVTVNVEYPIGGATQSLLFGGSAAGTVPNNDDVVSDTLTLSTPIPANASFKINVATTTPNGQNYISTAFNLGLTGVRTHAMSNTLKKEMIYGVGDSIMTNNGAMPHANCNQTSGCPSFQTSIGGTLGKTYAASGGAQFVRQIALAQKLGATRFFSNFGTNDNNAGDTAAQIQTSITTLRNMAAAVGIGWTHATMLVRSGRRTVTCSGVSFAGSTVTATVPDASLYVVGRIYTMSGASPANGYNATRRCIAVDTVLNTVSLESATPTAPTATGTIQLNNPYLYDDPNFLVLSAGYNGAGSTRGLVNNWIRTSGLVDVCEWSDNCETARDSGFRRSDDDAPAVQRHGNVNHQCDAVPIIGAAIRRKQRRGGGACLDERAKCRDIERVEYQQRQWRHHGFVSASQCHCHWPHVHDACAGLSRHGGRGSPGRRGW
jgi:hypothetical protein